MQLSIIMPCLNESETLSTCIKKAKSWIENHDISAEILIADNGSTDGSQKIAKSLSARVINVKQRGYGSALYHGCKSAKGEWVIMGDSDNSYDFSNLDPFVEKLDEGFDLVMGNRFLGGIEKGAMPWKNRYIGNPVLTLIGRILFKCPSKDFHCGLRAVRKDAFNRMDLRTTGMEFASEMVIKANLFNMKIAEVPTTLSKDGRSRPPHLRPWRDGWRHLRFMFLFSPRWLFLIPGISLFIISLISYILLILGPVKISSVTFDVHTLFYIQTGLIVGYLTMGIGVVTRIIAIREGLLNEHALLQKIHSGPILEIGSIIGLLMIAGGLYWGIDTLTVWSEAAFGVLEPGSLLRKISLSTTSILIGGITTTISLVIGFLSLPTRQVRDE